MYCSTFLHASEPEIPQLILNALNEPSIPKNFRSSMSEINNPEISIEGLLELRISGSGQFSELGLIALMENIPNLPLIVVDLREESHCFINGHAVSWRTIYNWANKGKSLALIEADEAYRREMLKSLSHLTLANDKTSVTIPIAIIIDEKTLVTAMGMQYLRIPVTDHTIPSDDEVDRFIAFYEGLAPKTWVHYHCSAGKGRSTLFMVMHDIMENGEQVSLKDILLRQGELGGKNYTLPIPSDTWKTQYQKEKLLFIQNFYNYRLETKSCSLAWSEWTKKQN